MLLINEPKVAVVVGGTSGLGLAVGQVLDREGFSVALAGRRADLAQEQATSFAHGHGVGLDLTDPDSIHRGLAEVREQLGGIDALVLSGGGPPPCDATDLDLDGARAAAELLVHGPIGVINSCLPLMRERKWGRILAIGSSSVAQPIPGLTTSAMYRAALASYLKLLAGECASDGVTVNMVLPGRIATDRVASLDAAVAKRTGRSLEDVRESSQATIPMGRYGAANELAELVAFLCSDRATYTTGSQVRVDGGLIRAL